MWKFKRNCSIGGWNIPNCSPGPFDFCENMLWATKSKAHQIIPSFRKKVWKLSETIWLMFNIWLLGKSILPQVDYMHQHFTVHTNPDLFMSQKRCEKISSNGQDYIWTRIILLEISMPNKRLLQLQIQALQVTECGYKQ